MAFITQHTDSSFPDYQPKRFGLKFDPPTIVLEYLVPSTGKLYHHRMRLRSMTPDSRTLDLLNHLKKRHSMYLNTSKISEDQLKDLIEKLKKRLSEEKEINLNKLTPEEVAEYKKKMDVDFEKNLKRPGDEDFEYDLRKDFKPVEDSGWDDEDEEDIVL